MDWIIANHDRKTHNKQFSAMLCVSSVDALITFYETFRRKKEAGEHSLRVATIFTYGPNEADPDADGLIGDPDLNVADLPVDVHKRDRLQSFVDDYNAMYQTKETVKDGTGFYTYYNHLNKRLKDRDRKDALDKDRLDILLVVNMFLTGFDAKKLNTLYVDKNLKYHGLIQAFSRTNRTLGQLKSHGNVVCFRNLKPRTDEAITLFSNKEAIETILVAPYQDQVDTFNDAVKDLLQVAPVPRAVDGIQDETELLAFVTAFRKVMRLLNVVKGFSEFDFTDLFMDAQTFEDFKSKYLDVYDKAKTTDDDLAVSIINEVDFELELIQRDEINVAYILALLAKLKQSEDSNDPQERAKSDQQKKQILDLLNSDVRLRSKRELIERFINEQMPAMRVDEDVAAKFEEFWSEEKQKAVREICESEGLKAGVLRSMIEDYNFTGKAPLSETVVDALDQKPKILERKTIVKRVTDKLMSLVKIFDEDIGNL